MNFYAVASLVVLATSMLSGVRTAQSWAGWLDDVVLAAIATFAFGWYFWGWDRVRLSPVPLVLLTLGLITELGGAWLAYARGVADNGDATAAVFLALTIGVTIWQLAVTRRAAKHAPRITSDDLLLDALRQRCRLQQPPQS